MKREYDAILLLGYGLDEHDQATQELQLRVKAAAKAYREGLSDTVVACGGTTPGHRVSEAVVMQALLMQEGVEQSAILLEDKSQITIENMCFAAQTLGGAKGKRVLVVTSDYHVRRAVLTAMRAGLRAKGYAAVLPHDEAWKQKQKTEFPYTVDMLLNWNRKADERPKWMQALFEQFYGKKDA